MSHASYQYGVGDTCRVVHLDVVGAGRSYLALCQCILPDEWVTGLTPQHTQEAEQDMPTSRTTPKMMYWHTHSNTSLQTSKGSWYCVVDG
jgi:hypothetical protein